MMKGKVRAAVTAALMLGSSATHADLQGQMNSLFGSMTNYTPPGYFESARRGVIGGGHYVQKNRIMSANLVSFVPPSLEAGCGGLDLNGGSFSFINADQFVQLLRSIASNAQGYAFQLALKAMSPSIAETMTDLQKKIQSFNEFFGDSCQMAQNLVDKSGVGSLIQNNSAKLVATLSGGADDTYDGFGNNTTSSAIDKAQSAAPATVNKVIKGNVVWRALKKSNAAGWFATGGDNNLLEAIMSVTGSVVVSDPVDAPDGSGKNFQTIRLPAIPGMGIEAMITGGEYEIYDCVGTGENQCITTNKQTINLKGFTGMAEAILLDPGNGLIHKFATNSGTPTSQQIAFLAAAPTGFGPMVRTLSAHSEALAREFVRQAAPFISVGMAQVVMNDVISTVRASMASIDSAHTAEVMEKIAAAQDRLDKEIVILQKQHNMSLRELFAIYEQFISNARKDRYWAAANTEAER